MDKKQIQQFVKTWIYRIWELQEKEHLGDFYCPDVVGYYNSKKVTYDILENKIGKLYDNIEQLEIEILHLVIERNKFALHAMQIFKMSDDKIMKVPSMIFVHLKEGKIHKYWLKTRVPFDLNELPNLVKTPQMP